MTWDVLGIEGVAVLHIRSLSLSMSSEGFEGIDRAVSPDQVKMK